MNFQKEKAMRELDTNIYKIVDSYRLLLRKGQVSATGTVGAHEELQVEAASASIVFHAQSILDQIHDLRMQLLLQESTTGDNEHLDP